MRLQNVAPLLAAARDRRLEQERTERAQRRELIEKLTHIERVLAHRELQEVRAATARKPQRGNYLVQRRRKTWEIRKALERTQARYDALQARALWNDPDADHWVNRSK